MPSKKVDDLTKQVANLEHTMNKHLEESGEIRTDLAWLKRAFWVLSGSAFTAAAALSAAVLSFLLHR